MKKIAGTFLISLLLSSCGSIPTSLESQAMKNENGMTAEANYDASDLATPLNLAGMPSDIYDLTDQQKADILFLFEEEKLAHDLYAALEEKWDARIFGNISKAESHHVDAIKTLIEKYGLALPANSEIVGEFDNTELKDLYGKLLTQGSTSENEARSVGVAVETKDIADIDSRLPTASPDVRFVLDHLRTASEKHLSAFEGNHGSKRQGQGKGSHGNGSGSGKGKMKRGGYQRSHRT